MRLQLYRGKFCVYWREGDEPVRRSLGTTDPNEAKRRFETFKRGIREAEESRLLTVADLWEARRQALQGRRTAHNMIYCGKVILPFFGALRPSQVTQELIDSFAKDSKLSPGTIWTVLQQLRSTLNWAEKKELAGKIPFFALPSKPPPKSDYLTKEQARAFLEACRVPHVRLFALMALATGARSGALLELTWDRIDFDRRLINLNGPDTEHRKGRAIVPINDMLLEALRQARETSTCPYVISWAGSRVLSVKKGIKAAASATGLSFVSPHVFRHSAAVWMAEAGVSMDEIAQFLGHSNVEITRRVYARYSPEYLKKAAKALEL